MYNENIHGEIPNGFFPNMENKESVPVFENNADTRNYTPPRKSSLNDMLLMFLLMSLLNSNERDV